jgi:hypothetical protein
VAVTIDGVVHPTTIHKAATTKHPAENETFTVALEVGQPTRIGFVWDWRMEPSSFRILQGKLPSGFAFDGKTGTIRGAPQTPGMWNVLLSVRDSRGRGYQWVHFHVE